MTNTEHIEKIFKTIEHHLERGRAALVETDVLILEDVGDNISSLGDMIRDAL